MLFYFNATFLFLYEQAEDYYVNALLVKGFCFSVFKNCISLSENIARYKKIILMFNLATF